MSPGGEQEEAHHAAAVRTVAGVRARVPVHRDCIAEYPPKKKGHLVIATWNANEVFRGKAVLENFLESISFRAFQIFRKDRELRGDGVAALIRNDLQARQIALHTTLEAVAVEVMVSEKIINFGAVYIPSKDVSEVEFRRLLVGPRTIIRGHFKAKSARWGCRRTNKVGKTLNRFIRVTRGLGIFAPEDGTSIPGVAWKRGDVLYIFLEVAITTTHRAS